jgi:HD-GYP domain-containing protein (c-di-GMP phosphodiesterase class II)
MTTKSLRVFPMAQEIPAEELATLLKVSSVLAASLDMPSVLQVAIDSTVEVLGLETGAIYLLEGDKLYLGATTPPLPPDLSWLLLTPEMLEQHWHLKKAFAIGEPVYIPDAAKANNSPAEEAIRIARQLKTILHIPLIVEGSGIGALIVGTTTRYHAFNEHSLALSRTLSYQIALAVANAKLYKAVQMANADLIHAYDVTLQGWSYALEMRDQDTQGHTRRVMDSTVSLARKMGFTEPALTNLRRGALLHDIGKISIPDEILKKPGPLTSTEMEIMRRHTDDAYHFLVNIDYLQASVDIPYCHHEKWDGTGYPRGLKGEEIPLEARIFAVVDVYDALISDRPYRKAWSKADALEYICAQSGKHFDPCIVPIFLEMISNQAH